MVDVRFDHRAIDPDLATVLDPQLLGRGHHEPIDEFQRLGLNPLEVLLQSRFAGGLLVDAEPAKRAIAARVGQMEGQLLVAEAVHLLQDHKAQDLVAGQAGTTRRDIRIVHYQIVVDQCAGLRHLVQKVADAAEFSCVFMVDKGIDNRQLFLYLLSQRDVTSMCKLFPS